MKVGQGGLWIVTGADFFNAIPPSDKFMMHCSFDLPLNFHPTAIRASAVLTTPIGVLVATGGNAKLSNFAALEPVSATRRGATQSYEQLHHCVIESTCMHRNLAAMERRRYVTKSGRSGIRLPRSCKWLRNLYSQIAVTTGQRDRLNSVKNTIDVNVWNGSTLSFGAAIEQENWALGCRHL